MVLQPRFEAEDMLRLIDRHKVSHMHIVPTMFVRLLRLPDEVKRRYDLSSLRWVTHGAAPCAPAVKRQMIEWWGPVINEYYGATETGIVVWHDSQEALAKPGTVGRVVEGAALRIVDEQGRDVKQGEVGEIYLRGPHLAEFTYNNDDAKRREIALGDLVTVGDVGYQDADGYVFLCDRKRDMIISGGVNIYPAEIELVLIQMPGVRDCAVFGIPDEEFGEQICAHVEPQAGRGDRCDGRQGLSRPAPGALQGAEGRRVQRRPAARGFGQDLQTQAARPILGKGGSQHLKEVMSDDDVTLFGKLKNKLIDSKQKWAESGRLLTGKTAAPLPAPAARPAPGRELAGARSRHPARDPDPRLAPVRRRRGREPDDLEMGRVHRPAQDHAHHRHPLRHRLVALRQQVGGRERARSAEAREAQGRQRSTSSSIPTTPTRPTCRWPTSRPTT